MSRFMKTYNATNNYWERIISKLCKDKSIITESYNKMELKYKTPIGLISLQIFKNARQSPYKVE